MDFLESAWKLFDNLLAFIQFLWFGIKSVFNLLYNILKFIVSGDFLTWFNGVYSGLSVYTGSFTNIIASFALLIVLMIVFTFVIRLFTGKLNFQKRVNGK